METVAAEPLRIVMSPERVSTSRSTGPLTWNERSKVPITEAKPAIEVAKIKITVRTARRRIRKELFIVIRSRVSGFVILVLRSHVRTQVSAINTLIVLDT